MNKVTVQFGENGVVQHLGNIGPFASVFASPNPDELEFDKVTVTANDGNVRVVKDRDQ